MMETTERFARTRVFVVGCKKKVEWSAPSQDGVRTGRCSTCGECFREDEYSPCYLKARAAGMVRNASQEARRYGLSISEPES